MADETARFVPWVVSPLGEILDCSSTYEPSQALQDLTIARDRTCRMTGCNPTGRVYTTPPDHLPGFDDTWREQDHDDDGVRDPDPP